MPQLIIVTGQTATGKTARAVELALRHNGELINFDSRQIYRGLDIITGKDLPKDVKTPYTLFKIMDDFEIGYYTLEQGVNIWLYDIIDPQRHFSSFEYVTLCHIVLTDIISRGKTPILIGGTGFYLKHLLFDIAKNQVAPDWNLRGELSLLTLKQLQSRYAKLDKEAYEKLNNSEKNNPQRLIRKIEITSATGEKPNEDTKPQLVLGKNLGIEKMEIDWEIFFKPREELEPLIRRRVQKRLDEGALDEIKKLLGKGYTATDPGMRTIGYQELIPFVLGKYPLERAVELWTTHELQYAKRQKTYIKKLTLV